MGTLNKKILRDIWKNKAQFITIFLMTFLAIFAFAGIHGYMDGMTYSSRVYYENQNLQDLWITSKNITDEKLEEIKKLDNVKNAERMITINANVIDSERFINPLNNEKISDLVLECNFIETNEINKMYLIEGEEFSKDKKGLWLDYYIAKNLGIKVGDDLELSIEGSSFKEKVVGLIEVPDHVYFIKDDTAIFPTHSDYGFVYLSIDEFPSNYIYDKILKSDEMKDAIDNLKELKNKLKDYGITDYNSIPSMITNSIDGIDKIDLTKALELVDDYDNNKQEFIEAMDKDFNIKDSYIYPYGIVDVENVNKIDDVKKDIKDKIEDIVTVTAREDNISYSGYQREAEEGETYSGVFSGLFVFIAILSVVTTMNRFVKKERTQIGTLKALGIKKYKITWMYVSYGLFIAIIAGILGIILGNIAIGNTFLEMEMEYYEIPYYHITTIPLVYYVTISIIGVITFVTYLSCRKVLKEPAAEVLRIERPKVKVRKNGITTKKFFNNLSLSTKWNLRDIGRSKARTLMAIVRNCRLYNACSYCIWNVRFNKRIYGLGI
ncbi:MAG: FtsX-like permease family protein [Clostridia bacterium]|nr:FtsX-like permease family protein [Clostridia bacterium]